MKGCWAVTHTWYVCARAHTPLPPPPPPPHTHTHEDSYETVEVTYQFLHVGSRGLDCRPDFIVSVQHAVPHLVRHWDFLAFVSQTHGMLGRYLFVLRRALQGRTMTNCQSLSLCFCLPLSVCLSLSLIPPPPPLATVFLSMPPRFSLTTFFTPPLSSTLPHLFLSFSLCAFFHYSANRQTCLPNNAILWLTLFG